MTDQYWHHDSPTVEGWYFWRKRRDSDNPLLWVTSFVADDRDDSETSEDYSCWADGTAVYWPKGGWWRLIE